MYITKFNQNCTAKTVTRIDKDIVVKKHYFTPAGIFRFKYEVLFLNHFSRYKNFPKLINYNPKTLEIFMDYCGSHISKDNIPDDYLNQLKQIVNILDSNNVILEDIQYKNILIKDEIIKLIDFDTYKICRDKNMKMQNYKILVNLFKRL